MTEIKELVEKLRALQKWATPGPWEIHDSCSWRRIGTARHDGNVLCPTNSRTDNHPDLTAGRGEDLQANLGLIVGAVNALPQLLAAIELLSSQVEDLKAALGETLAILEGPTPPAAEMFAAMDLARSALSQSGKE